MTVHHLKPRPSTGSSSTPNYRERTAYATFEEALLDALRASEAVEAQLDTALIPDPSDVRFSAMRASDLIRACLKVYASAADEAGAP